MRLGRLPRRLCLNMRNFKEAARDRERGKWPTRLHLRHQTAALMLFNLVSLQRLLLRNQRLTRLAELPEKSKELKPCKNQKKKTQQQKNPQCLSVAANVFAD